MKKLLSFFAIVAITNISFAQSLQPFRSAAGKWGYKDDKGNIVVPAKYEFGAKPFSGGMGVVWNSGLHGYGVVDATGKEVVAPQYTTIYGYVDGLAAVCANGTDIYGTNGKWGFIDTKGNVVIPVQYESVSGNFDGGSYAVVTKNKKQQVIDRTGKIISFPDFELLGTFYKSNYALAKKGDLYGMVDRSGKVIIPFNYDMLYGESEGMTAAKKDGLFGFIDLKNNWVIKPEYRWGGFFANGFVCLQKNDKYGAVSKTGKVIVPFIYDDMYPSLDLSKPVLIAKKDDKKGLVSPVTGKELTPIKYDDIRDFDEGVAAMILNKKYGVINYQGKEIVPPSYKYASELIDGLMFVQNNNDKYGFIDKTGKVIIPFKYDLVSEFIGGSAAVWVGDDKYYIDKKGERITQ